MTLETFLPILYNILESMLTVTTSPASHIAWFTQSTIQNYQRLLKEGIEGWVNGTLQETADKVHKVVVVHNGRIWN